MAPAPLAPPWRTLDRDGGRDGLQKRYDAETNASHPLARREGRVVARSDARDDTLAEASRPTDDVHGRD